MAKRSNKNNLEEVKELEESMTLLDVKEEDDSDDKDIWYDHNLLNDPAKLKRIKFTQKDLQLAESTTFIQSINVATEFVLQDRNLEVKLKHKVKSTEEVAIKTLEDVTAHIIAQQNKCREIRDNCSKKFWCMKKHLSPEQVKQVEERWMKNMDKLTATFAKVMEFRHSRKSMIPDESAADPQVETLMNSLKGIYDEMSSISKTLDCALASSKNQK